MPIPNSSLAPRFPIFSAQRWSLCRRLDPGHGRSSRPDGEQEFDCQAKGTQVLRAIALNLHFIGNRSAYRAFVADTLYYGDAQGKPVYGLRAASLVMFGKDPSRLHLEESALLAATLLHPMALSCIPSSAAATERFEQQRSRALKALDKGFADDPRYSGARTNLLALAPITAPAQPPVANAAGLPHDAACRAAPPLLRLEGLDSSIQLTVAAELRQLAAGGADVREMRLATNFTAQVPFKSAVERARNEIAATQAAHWFSDPSASGAVILAFSTSPEGRLSALYESSSDLQLHQKRGLGSLNKIVALAFLAEQGWTVSRSFCNKTVQLDERQLNNAGGDPGVPDCNRYPAGRMTVEHVIGHSISLAVYDALRQYPAASLQQRLDEWGIAVPAKIDPRYALSFGLARTTPAHMVAFFSAISSGLARSEPVGYEATALTAWRSADGRWHSVHGPSIDLSRAFSTPTGRALLTAGAGAAYAPGSTLAALGPDVSGAVGKSGTLDGLIAGNVVYKGTAGALAGSAWFAMAVPQQGALGDLVD